MAQLRKLVWARAKSAKSYAKLTAVQRTHASRQSLLNILYGWRSTYSHLYFPPQLASSIDRQTQKAEMLGGLLMLKMRAAIIWHVERDAQVEPPGGTAEIPSKWNTYCRSFTDHQL